MGKKIICVIPARGGSKRIPNKNLLLLGGKPLIVHSIEHARQSKLIKRIIVSTDDPEIARISKKCGAEVLKRPKRISGARATSESAIKHVIERLESSGYSPDLIVFLQCTSPVRNPNDIDNAIKKLYKDKADSLFSACRNDRFFWRRTSDGVEPINYDYRKRMRDQDHPEEYEENGSIFVFKTEILKKYNNRMGGKIEIYKMDYWSSFQVDTIEDVRLIDWILNRGMKSKQKIVNKGIWS